MTRTAPGSPLLNPKCMKSLFTILMLALICGPTALAREQTILARVTVYWPASENDRACSNGAKLRTGHCAVDPKRIPYGSKVLFPDTTCVAVDSGPAVISRTAARLAGKTALQRAAVVIDRFFETKRQALAWAASNPHFMTLRVLDAHPKTVVAAEAHPEHEGTTSIRPGPTQATPPSPVSRLSNIYSRNPELAPADVRGPLVPTLATVSVPRS
jgi:3D (Asp-Asp-Asp) domain-containing protein